MVPGWCCLKSLGLGVELAVLSPTSAHKGLWNKDGSTWKRHPSCIELASFMDVSDVLVAKGGGSARSGGSGGSRGCLGMETRTEPSC